MRSWYQKTALFLSLLLFPLLALNHLIANDPRYWTDSELRRYEEIPEQIELMVVGNSHSLPLHFQDSIDNISHNLAMSSQPFYYHLAALQFAKDKMKDGAIVLLQMSYFDWTYDDRVLFQDPSNIYNQRYYKILPRKLIRDYKFLDDLKFNHLPLLNASKYLQQKLSTLFPLPPTMDKRALASTAKGKGMSAEEEVLHRKEIAKAKATSWQIHLMPPADRLQELQAIKVQEAQALIAYCLEQGWRPVILQMPISYLLEDVLGEAYLKNAMAQRALALAPYPELPVIDFHDDQRFVQHLELFRDSDHLNANGFALIVPELIKELRALDYLPASD